MSKTAKQTKQLCFVLYDGVQLLDVAGPAEVFAQANFEAGSPVYNIQYLSDRAQVQSSAGLPLSTQVLDQCPDSIDLLLIPGASPEPLRQAQQNPQLQQWLPKAVQQSKELASICSGALILAELGLLDHKRCTSHWLATKILQQRHPLAKVVDNVLYIQDGNVWTSAGVLSGVDMALAIVARDLGYRIALAVAKNLVAFMLREGSQPQFSAPLNLQHRAANSSLLQLIQWLELGLDKAISVEQMAEFMATSVRSLHRRCLETLDLSPAKLFNELRLEQGKLLLHQRELPIKQIAFQCGFSNSSAFSKAFSQRHKISPLQYRHRVSRQPV